MSSFDKARAGRTTVIAMVGCSSVNIKAIKSPEKDNSSTITVFRPDVFAASGNDMVVAVNNNDVAVLRNSQYVSVLVTPGEHKVSVRGSVGFSSDVEINTKPAEYVFFEAAGSVNNSVDFVPGTVLLKANYYIEQADKFDESIYNNISVRYK
ncbi:MAG: hypothetical protein ACN4GM_09555 [Gammaproteobacteria bacterium]